MIAVRKLLQTTDTVQPVKSLMLSQFLQVKPEDERADVAGLLAHSGADVVPVVTHGKLVVPHRARNGSPCWKTMSPKMPSARGTAAGKAYLETSAFSLWKKRLGSACCCCLSRFAYTRLGDPAL